MADLGFGSLVDKFEENFGKRVTKVLLATAGLAFMLGCAKIIWEVALGPVVQFALGLAVSTHLAASLIQAAWFAGAWVFGIGISIPAHAVVSRWFSKRADAVAGDARENIDRAKEILAETKALLVDIREVKDSIDSAITSAVSNPPVAEDEPSPASPIAP